MAAQFPATAQARERVVHEARRFSLQKLLDAQFCGGLVDEFVRRLAQQALSTTVHQPELAIPIERERRHVDFLHDLG